MKRQIKGWMAALILCTLTGCSMAPAIKETHSAAPPPETGAEPGMLCAWRRTFLTGESPESAR